jgi:hypothetical protein
MNQATEHKHLGLEISSWKNNIDLITEESWQIKQVVTFF